MVERLKSELRCRAGWAVRGSKGRKVAAQEGQGRELDGEKANWQGLVLSQSKPLSSLTCKRRHASAAHHAPGSGGLVLHRYQRRQEEGR
ncbi:MAG TPA: hypothetical protein VE568_00745 [Rubrobacter sp.]|jgi:hypothetical protein|nr:hypothetical protein [Rubrobacter sp.]